MKKREYWVDTLKIIACILVALGHLFQGFVKSGILPSTNVYLWFNETIYYFHVPLFFIASGYIYQKFTVINSFPMYLDTVRKKLISLGIPYIVFSIATWILKVIFSDSVNNNVDKLADTLLLKPLSPYWFLYILFILFLITPVFKNKQIRNIMIFSSVALKIVVGFYEFDNYIINQLATNWIWFILGMLLCFYDVPDVVSERRLLKTSLFSLCAFVIFSILSYRNQIIFYFKSSILGIWACISIVVISIKLTAYKAIRVAVNTVSKYTMPIFLMHTIFAAGLRSVLFKLGIYNSIFHIIVGLFISFIGPIIAIEIMERMFCLDVLVYPGKYIKVKNGRLTWQKNLTEQ